VSDRERALQYIGIFAGSPDNWEFYIPVDGERTRRGVKLGSVHFGPAPYYGENVWFVDDGHKVDHFRVKDAA
jgi:hypothetical protein